MPKMFKPRSFAARKRYASGQPSGKSYPFKKNKGMNVRGGFTAAVPLKRRTMNDSPDIVGKFMDSAKEKGANVANDMLSKMAQQAVDSAADAATAAATKGAAKAKQYIKTKTTGSSAGSAKAKGPKKVFTEDPTVSDSTVSVGVRRINNSIVPDKSFNTNIYQGGMTKREEQFYKKWPLQDLLIYQSKTPGRYLHNVSPGSKSFYSPFLTQPLVPSWGNIGKYRSAVETGSSPGGASPSSEPPFIEAMSASGASGVVQGGLDFMYPLTLGTWNDYASCLSAMTGTQLPPIPDNYRVGSGYKFNFGIPKMTLDFHIENQNEYLPAQFTVQVHEYKGVDSNGEDFSTINPINSVFDAESTTTPLYARSFRTVSSVPVANDPAGSSVKYVNERSLLFNAPTFGGNITYANDWRMVNSQKVRITAGGRLKCKVSLDLPPHNAVEWLKYQNDVGQQLPGIKKRQLFVTILAQGTQEVYGDVYQDANYQYSTNFMTNPVQYTVSNITKKAKLYTPNLHLQTLGTEEYQQANVSFGNFASDLVAFGENKISQFVPEGQYDVPYSELVSADAIPTSGRSLVIPIMSNQQKESASTKRA